MAVLLDAKDLAKLDQEFAAESQVWDVLRQGAKEITESDFVGANEVRINKMTGFTASDYERNGDNARAKIDVSKETRKLMFERWMGYDLDALDQSENGSYNVAAVAEQHARLIAIPEKDTAAVKRLVENSGKMVKEAITTVNSLAAFDEAEQYMTDTEVVGPFVMFCSSAYYKALKNNDKVSKTFTVNEMQLNGIDRRVAMLDNDIPIVKVAKSRLQVDSAKTINFILVPLRIAAPIEKYNDITLVPASADRDGYRDTVKGLNYYDLIVFDNAKKAIYVSYNDAAGPDTSLSSLSIGSLTLDPTFDPDVTTYTTHTTNNTNAINATPTDGSATAAITVNGTSVNNGGSASWVVGENTVIVTVTNGAASEVYTVTVIRD